MGSYAFTGSPIFITVGTTGTYNITTYGAQGGASSNGHAGGLGGKEQGTVFLTAGERLEIIVGGKGQSGYTGHAYGSSAGGGGGGSFVLLNSGSGTYSLLIAGGGGGGGATGTAGAAGGSTGGAGLFNGQSYSGSGGSSSPPLSSPGSIGK